MGDVVETGADYAEGSPKFWNNLFIRIVSNGVGAGKYIDKIPEKGVRELINTNVNVGLELKENDLTK